MRILAANPDGLGDMILRQPLYAALQAAGHKLMLTVRRHCRDIAACIAPRARLATIDIDPYQLSIQPRWNELEPMLEAVRQFEPQMFLVTPYQWTLAEEWLARHLPDVPVMALSGHLFADDPRWGVKSESRLRAGQTIAVTESSSELIKNQALASALLGRKRKLPDPHLVADKEASDGALKHLNELGLSPGEYVVGWVGHGPYHEARNWRLGNWSEVLGYWAKRYGRKILLAGSPEEAQSTEQVCGGVSGAPPGTVVSLCRTLPLDALIGIIHHSRAYIGRDTGTMHLAAALGKPVIGVFGGGTWPRFQPAVTPSWVGIVNVPCKGCGWNCPFDESYCIKQVPAKFVRAAIDDLETGRLVDRVVREFQPAKTLGQSLIHQAMVQIASKTFENRVAEAKLAAADGTLEQKLTAGMEDLRNRSVEIEKKLQAEHEQLTKAAAQIERNNQLVAELQVDHAARARAAELAAQLLQAQQQMATTQEQLRENQSRLADAAEAMASKDARLDQFVEERDAGRRQLQEATAALRAHRPPPSNPRPWPYSAPQAAPLPATLPGGKPWPRISIVTPSFNQGQHIEQTILSVLNQNYPNLQYVVIDGASTDETMAVVRRYEDRISHVVSEKDGGQSCAINKGFGLSDGQLLGWLNSDDMLEPGALAAMAMAFASSGADMVAGVCTLHRDGQMLGRHLTSCRDGPLPLLDLLDLDQCWLRGEFFYQPEVMFARDLWERAGGKVDEGLFYSMDYDLWVRFAKAGANLHVIGRPIALFRIHEKQKTFHEGDYQPELRQVRDRHVAESQMPEGIAAEPAPTHTHLRVVFFNDLGNGGGAGIGHQRLATAVAQGGHEVIPLAIRPQLGACRLPNEQIFRAIEERAPDLVVLGNIHSAQIDPGLIGLVSQRWPTIQVLHDMYSLTGRCAYTGDCRKYVDGCDHTCPTPQEYPTLDPALIRQAWQTKHEAMSGPRAPVLAAVSQWTRRMAEGRFENAAADARPKIIPIRIGLPIDIFRPRDKAMCREILGLPSDRFIILFSSSHLSDQRKGLPRLIEALEILKLPDLLACCIGHFDVGPTAAGVEVRNMGFISDPNTLAALYSAVDLFVGPSQVETFGQVFIEAAACGTPSVGFAGAGGVAEAIADQLSGCLAALMDASDLARVIRQLYDQPQLRQDMAVWGRLWVENEYSFRSAYQQLLAQLNGLDLLRQWSLPPKVLLEYQTVTAPAVTYLDAPSSAAAATASQDGVDPAYGLARRLAAVEAERDSLRTAIQAMRQTRLWRMVERNYPIYQRLMGATALPRVVRRAIHATGSWLAERPDGAPK